MYKIYMVYIDFITMLIIEVLSFPSYPFPHLGKLLLVRYNCLRLFVVLLQDLHCLQRFYHNVDHWGIKLYYHTKFHI